MNEEQLRAIIRDAVARHLGGTAPRAAAAPPPAQPTPEPGCHASQVLYLAVINAGDACVIEPAVECDHCGYCRSHGF